MLKNLTGGSTHTQTWGLSGLPGLTEATSKDGRGCCCAKAIQRGASEPASMRAPKTIALAVTLLADARGENVRPRRRSISMRSPMLDLQPKMPTASSSRDSVCIGLLHMIDDEHFDRAFLRFQFQAQLLLYCREDGGPERVGAPCVCRRAAGRAKSASS